MITVILHLIDVAQLLALNAWIPRGRGNATDTGLQSGKWFKIDYNGNLKRL